MSENNVRWLAPLQTDTAEHLAALLTDDAEAIAHAASDAALASALLSNGAPGPVPPAALPEAAAEAEPAAPAAEGGLTPATPPASGPGETMIQQAVQGKTGLVMVAVRELPYPLWFRAGTGDAAACLAALSPESGGGRIPYQPRRILELGAGAGYRTVALARSFPEAEIIATESDPGLERVARLNTLPYRNVSFMPVPVTLNPARFGFDGRRLPSGSISLAPRADGAIRSMALAELVNRPGWENYDTVIVTPDPACINLLRANPWPASVRMIIIQTGGDPLGPQVAAAYPDARFVVRPEGEYTTVYRREVAASLPPPVPVPVFDPSGPAVSIVLSNVADLPARYFPIFPHGFRLHPNAPREAAPELSVAGQCSGYKKLSVRLRVGHKESRPVKFSVTVIAEPMGRELAHAEEIVAGGAEAVLAPDLPPYFGACRIVFSTRMAEPGGHQLAWAEFLDAAFI